LSPRSPLRFCAAGAIVWASFGCTTSPEVVEAHGVALSIDRLRAAPAGEIEGRRRLVVELEARPARLKQAKEARDVCSGAFRAMLDGLALKERARSVLAGEHPARAPIAQDLSAAQAKLIEADDAMRACVRAETELRRALAR
jgi:hypothetical protein